MDSAPEKASLKYEGKAKKVWETVDPARLLIEFKDDATAFNAQKRGSIAQKGRVNNAVTSIVFEMLERQGVPTHFLSRVSDRESLRGRGGAGTGASRHRVVLQVGRAG